MRNKPDYFLLGSIIFLVVFGIIMLSGVSADFSQRNFGNSTYYLFHQMLGLTIGILAAFTAYRIPLSFFKKWAWLLVAVNLILMALVFIPGLGITSGGAARWLNLGFFTFQPSELLKLTLILYFAVLLAKRAEKKWKYNFVPFIITLIVVSTLFYFQLDASTLILIFIITGLMYFISGIPLWHVSVLSVLGLGGLALFISEPYRMNRILVYLGRLEDPMRFGYQIEQALITVGSGGIFGLGLGMSIQKVSGLLPQIMSDSIFAVIAEELGFIWAFILVFAYLFFLHRSFKIIRKSNDKFSRLFAMGFSSWICIQAFINIGAMIRILPLTGIPLPFISYGGSHVIAELIGVGILLNISKSVKKMIE